MTFVQYLTFFYRTLKIASKAAKVLQIPLNAPDQRYALNNECTECGVAYKSPDLTLVKYFRCNGPQELNRVKNLFDQQNHNELKKECCCE